MYGRGSIGALITGSVTTGSGVVAVVSDESATVLPYAAGVPVGLILAYTAIGIGITILMSQIVVRVMRTMYQK